MLAIDLPVLFAERSYANVSHIAMDSVCPRRACRRDSAEIPDHRHTRAGYAATVSAIGLAALLASASTSEFLPKRARA